LRENDEEKYKEIIKKQIRDQGSVRISKLTTKSETYK